VHGDVYARAPAPATQVECQTSRVRRVRSSSKAQLFRLLVNQHTKPPPSCLYSTQQFFVSLLLQLLPLLSLVRGGRNSKYLSMAPPSRGRPFDSLVFNPHQRGVTANSTDRQPTREKNRNSRILLPPFCLHSQQRGDDVLLHRATV